jgi:hypothetical protein
MNKITVESFNKKISIERVLCHFKGSKLSPTVVIIAGIHGNERAGVFAAKKVINSIRSENINCKGNLIIISGNLNALKKNIRFDTVDLNRLWTCENISHLISSKNGFNEDVKEQLQIYHLIKDVLSNNKGPFFFIDLHSTSALTKPFITISDSLNNRKFASKFSIPVVLGIEEYLDGPLLTYMNEFGHRALGFEGGQHLDQQTILNCEAFIWIALVESKCLEKKSVEKYSYFKNVLSGKRKIREYYEIDYRYFIQNNEKFEMINGFQNFQSIKKNQCLAQSNSKEVRASMDGKIFMPLYQSIGNDGFFIITRISLFWLEFSAIVRKLRLYQILRLLPGIKKDKSNQFTLIVNPKTVRYLALEIFHLFGYRKRVIRDHKFHFIKRDRKVTEFK